MASKSIAENKLKAFEEGTMLLGKKGLNKREQEELRRKQDQVAAAAVYDEFVASFSESSKQNKAWVKGEVVNADKSNASKSDKGKLYKPTSKLAELASTFQTVKSLKEDEKPSEKPVKVSLKKKPDERKKSNLELFKEELKRIQGERDERQKIKRVIRGNNIEAPSSPIAMFPEPEEEEERRSRFEPELDLMPAALAGPGIYDLTTDETSTNIYISSINPKMTEKQLMELFGRFGPLASVKIMWPRTDEEKSRGRNCGFVAFMNRKDGERALKHLKGREIGGFEMKLGWGKPVPIPPHPIYIPPALVELTQPPPPSGLPFNAQPRNKREFHNTVTARDPEELEKTLAKAVVKVVIPMERNLLCIIHRMVEFVVREGPMFEAMIMNREINNPMFKFLFDNQSPAHVYYRWKLFSILNGDQPYQWKLEEFRMFNGGSCWKPPLMNPYTLGMPDELVDTGDLDIVSEGGSNRDKEEIELTKKGTLTDSQRDRLEDMLRELVPERPKVGEAMIWCLDHAEAAEEVVECISESLAILLTPIPKKIARLFLVSDILFNSSAKVPNASFYRRQFQRQLPHIFMNVHEAYENINGRLKAEQFKQKVMLCFRAWEDWAVYPNEFLINLQNIFLGLVAKEVRVMLPSKKVDIPIKPDFDGMPLVDSDFDGTLMEHLPVPRKPVASEDLDGVPLAVPLDLDGEPIQEVDSDVDGKLMELPPAPETNLLKFTKSKWETVDETELEAQAMTTSKWDLLGEDENKQEEDEQDEDLDGKPIDEDNLDGQEMMSEDDPDEQSRDSLGTPRHGQTPEMTEDRRRKLREIEVKVMKYQDELEAGKRNRKPNMSLVEQIQHHRKQLLAKEFTDSPNHESKKRHRSESPSSGRYSDDKYSYEEDSPKQRKRNKSPKKSRRSHTRSRSRTRSRSPRRKSRSHSPNRQKRKSKKNKHRD